MDGTPHLLTDVKFSERRRGYAPEEVDNFLERVSSAVAQLQDKLRDATAQAEEADARIDEATRAQTVAEAQVDQLKAELQKAAERAATDPAPVAVAAPATDPAADAEAASSLLLMAKKTADATIDEARAEAESTLTEARSRATTLVADAEAESTRIRTDAQRIADDLVDQQRAAARAEVAALEEMKGSIQADIDALQRHVDRERTDLRAAVARLSEIVDNPAALRVGEAPVGDTPGVEGLLAPAAGVEAIDELDDPATLDDEILGEIDDEPVEPPEPQGPAADAVDEPVTADAEDAVEVAEVEVADVAAEAVEDAVEVEVVESDAPEADGDAPVPLFADPGVVEPDDARSGPPTEAFQPFADDAASSAPAYEGPRDEDEDKAMRAFFETDFESMEVDKRSRWRR